MYVPHDQTSLVLNSQGLISCTEGVRADIHRLRIGRIQTSLAHIKSCNSHCHINKSCLSVCEKLADAHKDYSALSQCSTIKQILAPGKRVSMSVNKDIWLCLATRCLL